MGKGGNAVTRIKEHKHHHGNLQLEEEENDSATLRAERQAKMEQEPKFYWASGDSMEEPHVLRYIPYY
jgi:hypothetical protein